MIILDRQISQAELSELAGHIYGDMVKAVADVDNSRKHTHEIRIK